MELDAVFSPVERIGLTTGRLVLRPTRKNFPDFESKLSSQLKLQPSQIGKTTQRRLDVLGELSSPSSSRLRLRFGRGRYSYGIPRRRHVASASERRERLGCLDIEACVWSVE